MSSSSCQLIVGLGNPGREYTDTRHNIGFMIVDRLAAKAGAEWRSEKRWESQVARAGSTWLLKPQTFMNLSGRSVAHLTGFYKIPVDDVLVVLDDMALPLGKLRFRANGSAGGHNGLQSVIEHLGTAAVPRLRVGIGAALPGASVSHVLGRFRDEERPVLNEVLDRTLDAIQCAHTEGLPTAMNRFN
ncbi:MAG TPA: aminoacyl-tRNA hydrolase [Chthoniobacteraceae bacterium]|jgi:PTH1 family peptidyl-tRNA hydrolase|nr:aminoacyl-tRNA hydrolase [Chthoniobacteraceae bacterium]